MSYLFIHIIKPERLSSADFWQTRNESSNFNQRHEVELIKEEKRKVVEAEIRVEVMLTTEYKTFISNKYSKEHLRNLTEKLDIDALILTLQCLSFWCLKLIRAPPVVVQSLVCSACVR